MMSLLDDNRQVLQKLAENGVDLGISCLIDFCCVFPSQSAAESFASAAAKEGYATAIRVTENEDNPWDAIATRAMKPTCEDITAAELQLAGLARFGGGSSDGWGFFEAKR